VNSLFVNLSFTIVPVTNTQNEFVDLALDWNPLRVLALSHSRVYEQPATVKLIADWMKVRAGVEGARTGEDVEATSRSHPIDSAPEFTGARVPSKSASRPSPVDADYL
jgi:hypothetical protein